jgi:tRNA nucleotidyltransferase/poly(A) polymerase
MSKIDHLLQQHPEWPAVESIYHTLRQKGYKAFLAGGCVRDALLGRLANDLDIATDATPDQIEALFPKTINVGKSFGVMRVLEKGEDIEVATFRTDGDYKDGRRPEEVTFSSPEEDALRRDFTMNALFYDLEKKEVLDFVGGQEDISKQIIRTVGEADKRFNEDHLRLLRAVRFTSQLNFKIDSNTFAAIQNMNSQVKTVSGERLRDEWVKLLKGVYVETGLEVAVQSGMMKVLFPFRKEDAAWNTKEAELANEAWMLLALFLRSAPKADLESALNTFKLSTKERRSIDEAWSTWQSPTTFTAQRWGEQLQFLAKPGILFALRILELEPNELKLGGLLLAWESMRETLPMAFLNGEDIKGQLKGPEIGRCLQEAYNLQLEDQLSDREAALKWLSEYLMEKSH